MKTSLLIPVWLIVLIAGLPQFAETVYTPSLPDIARSLVVSENLVEYTLTIYLASFAIGTLVWGNLSDKYGRKPCLIMGLLIFILGCIGCYFSSSIELLMIGRFIQGFGGSTGSVLGQAICRDTFKGQELGKVFSAVGGTLAFAPAIGPVFGGFVDQYFGWPAIFLCLMSFGFVVLYFTHKNLPETHFSPDKKRVPLGKVALRLFKDRSVLGYAILVGGCNGIAFSYYAEGSFYLIDLLKLTPSLYGMTFILIAAAGITGSFVSKGLHKTKATEEILKMGLKIILTGAILFACGIYLLTYLNAGAFILITYTLFSMMLIVGGAGMVTVNSLSLALKAYQEAIGTASALFGCLYYTLISLVTLGMGTLHDDTLFPMPLYFLSIACILQVVSLTLLRSPKEATIIA